MALANAKSSVDLGPAPNDWEVVPLGELLTFQNGVNADKGAYGRGIRFANVLEVITNTHLRSEQIPGRVSLPPQVQRSYAVRAGDVLFNRTSETQEELGLAAIYTDREEIVFGGFVIRGQLRNERLNPTYAGYGLRAPIVRSQIIAKGQGAIRANIGQGQLSSVLIALPPLFEQEAIAEALSDADALIESLEQLIAKKRMIKQGAMQELLTGKRRLPGFEGEWAFKRLGDLATMASGGTPPSSNAAFYDGGILWASISDMTSSGRLLSTTERTLTEAGLNGSAAQMFPAGTVMYAMYASLGECAIATIPLSCSQAILGIRAKTSELDHEFLYYYLCSIKERIKRSGQQGTQSNLNKGMVQALELALPERKEQKAIASVLREMDQELDALEAKLEKARMIKQGMMHNLLTGKIRLV